MSPSPLSTPEESRCWKGHEPPGLCPAARRPARRTYPGLSLGVQRPPHLLLKQGVGSLQGLVLPGQLAEPQVSLFSGCSLNIMEKKSTRKCVT